MYKLALQIIDDNMMKQASLIVDVPVKIKRRQAKADVAEAQCVDVDPANHYYDRKLRQ